MDNKNKVNSKNKVSKTPKKTTSGNKKNNSKISKSQNNQKKQNNRQTKTINQTKSNKQIKSTNQNNSLNNRIKSNNQNTQIKSTNKNKQNTQNLKNTYYQNNYNLQEKANITYHETSKRKNKKKLIIFLLIIVVILVIAILGILLVNNNKKVVSENETKELQPGDTVTKDTLFLCSLENNTNNIVELVKASDEKKVGEICNGDFIGRYTCQNKYCGYSSGGQFWNGYVDYQKGISVIYDYEEEGKYFEHNFLYDFKNNKKLSEEFGFSMIAYQNNQKAYFIVYQDNTDYNNAIIDNNGKKIIDFKYNDLVFDLYSLENNARDTLLSNDGIVLLGLNKKMGIYNLEKEKLINKVDYNQIGYYKYLVEYPEMTLKFNQSPGDIANIKLNQIYVEKDGKGQIIDYETGKVVKNLKKTYDFAYPLSKDLVLTVDNKNVDILNEEFKSILKENLSYNETISLNWDNSLTTWDNYDFKNFKIKLDNREYTFNLESKTLKEK